MEQAEQRKPDAHPRSKWGGIREVAAILSVSPATAERMKAAGRLPQHTVLGKQLHRWDLDEIEAWMRAGAPSQREWRARQALKSK